MAVHGAEGNLWTFGLFASCCILVVKPDIAATRDLGRRHAVEMCCVGRLDVSKSEASMESSLEITHLNSALVLDIVARGTVCAGLTSWMSVVSLRCEDIAACCSKFVDVLK